MEVRWGPEAKTNLTAIGRSDPQTARRIAERVEAFARSGDGDVRKLEGSADEWRIRVGDWRAVFAFTDSPRRMEIIRVANRRDAYR